MPIVLLVHGPNLNLLGQREPDVYGTATLDDYVLRTGRLAESLGLQLESYQSNHEGDIVDRIHQDRQRVDALIVNAGALTHYSWSLHDALATFAGPIVEVHISQPNAREPWRHTSVVAPVASGSIAGFGLLGYELAIRAISDLLQVR
ncbi:MAG: 3-dehydroquinate dehydratase [Actinomycetota bacterium]|nr:3-dehydroquinate dehydratase [Actinomycetota bacterium]MDA3011169.1 3-dehydroquinate dehydratase [Actinomycetota bacterium]MDA3023906.1 3-dehydroquinate dehydratase [Actinomycetota bacterium]